ncbi:MAG TPA: glycosyltransferase family 9 protein [Ktedonobacterales bacterium]
MARSEPPRRIVCIRPGALGDTLLTLPALALLRERWPGAEITFVARRETLPLAQASGLAHSTYAYELPAWSALFAEELAAGTGASDRLPCSLAGSAVIAWLHDGEGLVARNLGLLGASPVVIAQTQPQSDPPEHMALTLARGAAGLGVTVRASVEELRYMLPPLRAPAQDEHAADELWRSLWAGDGGRVIALHPGSGGAAKRWPPESFAALARELLARGERPLLIEGPQDAGVIQRVREASGDAAAGNVPVACGLSIGALAALLPRCAAYVGNDSGVTHLAALVGTRTVALFGPSDPAIWAPLGERVQVIRAAHGRMEEITPEEVETGLSLSAFVGRIEGE